MLPTICFSESKRDLEMAKAGHTVLTQQIQYDGKRFELNCEFIGWSFSDFVQPERYTHPSPPVSRLILVERGRVELDISGAHYTFRSGNICLVPADRPFCVEYLDHCVTKGFHLHLYDALQFPVVGSLYTPLETDAPELAAALLSAIARKRHPSVVEGLVMTAVTACLEPLFPILCERNTAPLLYRRVLQAFHTRPPAALRLTGLADEMHVTADSLAKGFARQFRMSFKSYQQMRILTQARALLDTTDAPVGEIAEELGFNDLNYFYVFFRRMTGITPLQYRHNDSRKTSHR